ncbi:hypothetical protein NDU88_000581 [Pleurodeles waltl]|uniref:Uncharacterized protein n=1 Tax=Pleurodeles waltl TaxID=8319 RepID=A0AAV7KPS1_PLEWA|nr:hypothetical protein NDU88_000581 [Pleurodeles waltl]
MYDQCGSAGQCNRLQKDTLGHVEQCPGGAFALPEVTSQDVNPDIWVKKEDRIRTRVRLLGNAEEPEDADEREKQENGEPKTDKPGTPLPKTPLVETPSRRDQTNVKAGHVSGVMLLTQVCGCLLNPLGYWW